MNPQYGNQYQGGYGQGYGVPSAGQRPPGPPSGAQNMYNGVGMGQRPPGPPGPGQFGNPMQTKGVVPGPPPGQFGQPGLMQNGPATGTHGPQGDQYGMPRPLGPGQGQYQRPMGPGAASGYGGPPGPPRGPQPGATNQVRVTSDVKNLA
ncbi:protein tfg-1-like [Liolophura sinensis]|uniref:protein tfg-1-like n=1 Tax=Liolophura sinensis TaxID=3198878 RepID=UPI003158681E